MENVVDLGGDKDTRRTTHWRRWLLSAELWFPLSLTPTSCLFYFCLNLHMFPLSQRLSPLFLMFSSLAPPVLLFIISPAPVYCVSCVGKSSFRYTVHLSLYYHKRLSKHRDFDFHATLRKTHIEWKSAWKFIITMRDFFNSPHCILSSVDVRHRLHISLFFDQKQTKTVLGLLKFFLGQLFIQKL